MAQEPIKIDEDHLLKIINWNQSETDGLLFYKKTKNDLTEQQTIQLRKKQDQIQFKWDKTDLQQHSQTTLFYFKSFQGTITHSYPKLENQKHFDVMLQTIENTLKVMNVSPQFHAINHNKRNPSKNETIL